VVVAAARVGPVSDRIRRKDLKPCGKKKHEWVAEIIEMVEGWAIEPRCIHCFITGSPEDVTLGKLLDTITTNR
jgi:hypothetical protein